MSNRRNLELSAEQLSRLLVDVASVELITQVASYKNCFIKQTTFRQNPPLPSVTDTNGHDIIDRSHKKQPNKKAKQRVYVNLYSTYNVSIATRTFVVPHTAAMLYPTYE